LILPYSPGGIAFINGGTRFVTPSILPAIGRIDLWDTATLQPVGEPLTAPTTESLFSNADPRGTKIAIGSYSGITTVLDVDPHDWQRTACRLAGRNLTRTEWARYLTGQAYRKTCPQWPAGRCARPPDNPKRTGEPTRDRRRTRAPNAAAAEWSMRHVCAHHLNAGQVLPSYSGRIVVLSRA
jgi:hypothetical protein